MYLPTWAAAFSTVWQSGLPGVNDRSREVSINDGWEAGIQWSPAALLNLRLSYWRQNASNEFINVDGVNRNVGKTDRSGFDMAFNGSLNEAWSYWGNFALIDSEIARAATSQRAFEGNQLRGIPDYVALAGPQLPDQARTGGAPPSRRAGRLLHQ